MHLNLSTVLLAFAVSLCSSHPNGAPSKSCKSLLPKHKHIRYDETSARIETHIIDGDTINIKISTNNKPFKGT